MTHGFASNGLHDVLRQIPLGYKFKFCKLVVFRFSQAIPEKLNLADNSKSEIF